MARRRKKSSSGGGGIALLFLALLGVLAAIPKAVWIGGGIVLAVALVIYFWAKAKRPETRPPEEASLLQRQAAAPKPTAPASARQAPSPAAVVTPAVAAPRVAAAPVTLRPSAPAAAAPAKPASAPVQASASRPAVDDEPVAVYQAHAPVEPSYRLPPSPSTYGEGRWIPPGEAVEVGGVRIPGGMVYVGTSLATPTSKSDPCLIDPSKGLAGNGDYTQRQMDYWPSYSEVSPSARRAYLNWLADGRKDPRAEVGFVFLFFYGLERRAIVDGMKPDGGRIEWDDIAAEVRRLLAIYGSQSHSFQGYASSFLGWVELAVHPDRLYEKPVPFFSRTWELPLYVRLALGQTSMDGVPVPSHLALAWVQLDPNIYLRTPATRCPDEFALAFAERYAALHGAGIKLPRNKTKLKLVYQPASSGFRGFREIKLTFNDTPDVTVLTAPITKLKQVADEATAMLDGFSRLAGRDPDAKNSLEGLLVLPPSLRPAWARDAFDLLRSRMVDGTVAMGYSQLLASLGAKTTFARDKTEALVSMLQKDGIGFEPDVLAGAKLPKLGDTVVLFTHPTEAQSRSDGTYMVAALTLQLASAVASADGDFGEDEQAHLKEAVKSWNHLSPEHNRRLLAHLEILFREPASLTALKKKLEPLDGSVKQTIATFMATVAQSDGEVSPSEVKMLEKVYKALGIDSNKVFSDVHAAAAGSVPASSTVTKVESTGFKLDAARIAALQQDTEKVTAMLANIFTEAEEAAVAAPPPPPEVESEPEAPDASTSLLGLDEAHTALARMLLSRPEWSREELMDIASDLDLMLDGALEQINEAAFDTHDMPFIEGEDPVTVNPEFLEKVEA